MNDVEVECHENVCNKCVELQNENVKLRTENDNLREELQRLLLEEKWRTKAMKQALH